MVPNKRFKRNQQHLQRRFVPRKRFRRYQTRISHGTRRTGGEQSDCERKTKATRWAVLGSRFTIHCRVMRKTTSCALKRFPRTTSPKFTIMCANRAFLRTPEVELHGEHRVFPLSRDRGVRHREARSSREKKVRSYDNYGLFFRASEGTRTHTH